MLSNKAASLRSALGASTDLSGRFLADAGDTVALGDLVRGSYLGGRVGELRGRSVLISTRSHLRAATTLIELDGIARRLILCPPGLPSECIPFVAETAAVDTVVSDETAGLSVPGVDVFVTGPQDTADQAFNRTAPCQTEWILLTSGTTGLPKLVVHTLESLTGAIQIGATPVSPAVWSTFYDIRRYGGLQIFLRAILSGASLVLTGAQESTSDFLARAGALGVTHISGTPSHWRGALMSASAHLITPRYVRLSGEVANQAILNHLASFYPQAAIAHAFASTEAGVAFDVTDGLAGFPASLIGATAGVDMRVDGGSLQIRSSRTANRYLGRNIKSLRGSDDYVDTGDIVELRDGRFYFVGRQDGVINIGGLKVHPEEIESVINDHPGVRMSLVRKKKNPITGALVVADVVLKTATPVENGHVRKLEDEILQYCRGALPRHKVPASIRFISHLPVASTGKIVRDYA